MNISKHTSEFENIIQLIEASRNRAFSKVNAELVILYFTIGKVVSSKVAEGVWGENTVDELAKFIEYRITGLTGFNRRGLYRMKQFYETYNTNSDCYLLWLKTQNSKVSSLTSHETENDTLVNVSAVPTHLPDTENQKNAFVSAVLTQISWSNHLEILSGAKKAEEKIFYLLMAIKERWGMRELRRQIQSAIFERTMMSGVTQTKTIPNLSLITHHFKDPYIFEFLDLPIAHSENDLEKALIKNLQKFILEIGKGFTYMGNQYRLQVGNKDYYTDLLFYHRDLQCLVLFELKIQEFEPEFLGKLNFYLEALDRDVKRLNENPSIGILLCKGKDTEVVEYALARNTSPAMIADYETKLIDKKILADKLHQLVEFLTKKDL